MIIMIIKCIVTLDHMKMETCVRFQNNQDLNVNTVHVHDNIKLLIYTNSRWPQYDLSIIITYQLNDGTA